MNKRYTRRGLVLILLICTCGALCACGERAPEEESEVMLPMSEPLPELETLPELESAKTLHLSEKDLSEGTLVVVNGELAIDPDRVETVSLYDCKSRSYSVGRRNLTLRKDAAEALNDWMDAAKAHDGLESVNVVAGYRSKEDQQSLYDKALQKHGEAYAAQYFQLPGHSEHHTGLAVDLNIYDAKSGASYDFKSDGVSAWAAQNAWQYGFVLRYPADKVSVTGIANESWHYRYVGIPHAALMEKLDYCLEEYLAYLRLFSFEGERLSVVCGDTEYEIYFCEGLDVKIPADRRYTVSGNNADGFIVTVEEP